MPGVRRVRPALGRGRLLSRVRLQAPRRDRPKSGATIGRAGRVTAGRLRAGPRKVRTPQGRTLGKSQAAKADGKWHRKETARSENSPETLRVRVKQGVRAHQHRGDAMASQTPSGARRSRLRRRCPPRSRVRRSSRRETAGLERWSSKTESGLQACYGKSPGNGAFSSDRRPAGGSSGSPRGGLTASVEPPGAVARRGLSVLLAASCPTPDANTVSFGVATCDRSRFDSARNLALARSVGRRGCTKQPLDATS